MDKKLTLKQARFVDEYMIDGNATQAAIRSGYSKRTAGRIGAENVTKPVIREEIEIRRRLLSEKTGVDAAYVLRQAQKLHERCMQELEPVMVGKGPDRQQLTDEEGRLVFAFDAGNAARALDLIGKHVNVQAFNEKSSVNHTIDVSGLPDSELDAIIQSALR